MYSKEPEDKAAFTQRHNRAYTRTARLYDFSVKLLPVWKAWLRRTLPHIKGSRVLEVSFGTGYLLTQYACNRDVCGLEFNARMIQIARSNLARVGAHASLIRGTVDALPLADQSFDSVINTMAFSGYPDALRAMSELHRVLKRGGRLILIDVNCPSDSNWIGSRLTSLWKLTGDLIRDMNTLLGQFGFEYSDQEIGARGSIHLYVATKMDT